MSIWNAFSKCVDMRLSRCARWLILFIAPALACACATIGNEFTLDVSEPDPLIYSPGSAPGHAYWVSLEGFALTCDQTTVTVAHPQNGSVTLILSRNVRTQSSPFRTVVAVKLTPEAANRLAEAEIAGSLDDLTASFKTLNASKTCRLTLEDTPEADIALKAALAVHEKLPRRYSAVLRSAYNHRVWPQDRTKNTTGVSIDLFAGMRLRIENSLPISPYGAGSNWTHPSSFAAPTYLYFHALSGAELCDPRSKAEGNNSRRCAERALAAWENSLYLSPNGGLARLGLVQRAGAFTTKSPVTKLPSRSAPPVAQLPASFKGSFTATSELPSAIDGDATSTKPQRLTLTVTGTLVQVTRAEAKADDTWDVAIPVSGLIDLLEWTSVGEGAQGHWRLWLPGFRDTTPATPITADNGGSKEGEADTPLLFSAAKVEDLPSNKVLESPAPCKISENTLVTWTCYRLHYRVVPVPEISVWINGAREWVSAGTTLRDVLAERLYSGHLGRPNHFSSEANNRVLSNQSTADLALARVAAAGIQLSRLYGDGAHPVRASSSASNLEVARFLRIQLLPGDEITWLK